MSVKDSDNTELCSVMCSDFHAD